MIIARKRHHRVAAALFAVAAATFALAGCSTAVDGGELKSGNADAAYEEWNDKFHSCMGDNGIDLSANSGSSSNGPEGHSNDSTMNEAETIGDPEAVNEAIEKCLKKVGEPPADPNMPSVDEINEQQLAFAKCMRQAGHDYPDPKIDPNGGVAMSPSMPGEWQPDIDRCSKEANMLEGSSVGGSE